MDFISSFLLKAGGSGLNLTAASHVIHFDRWWNPAVENQATDRAFVMAKAERAGSQVRLPGTVEELTDRYHQQTLQI